MAQAKTNAMRILDKEKLDYSMYTYENKDGKIDGVSAAEKIGRPLESVFKTLVTAGKSGALYVFVVPVAEELDLKKAARAADEKNIEMIPVKDIQKWTGYIRGGCSPVGMKKQYPTFIHESAESLDRIIVSGGRIGMQIELKPGVLQTVTQAVFADIIK
ncbi:Cys-tRNA(Pro) deacylase [Peribacillus kribbensis]|uniref:Cys-tRNA(Pro) deacylase n=1 Tax=Peribacillus kribbensis TaxID=356658 RepID=UPI00041EF3C6|nr:Cys-tRNA(Pro) deacylase [Peribacillus kribbensis]